MSENFSFVNSDKEDQLFLGSLQNLFLNSYTNKTFIDTFWTRETPKEADISKLEMFNVQFEKGKGSNTKLNLLELFRIVPIFCPNFNSFFFFF